MVALLCNRCSTLAGLGIPRRLPEFATLCVERRVRPVRDRIFVCVLHRRPSSTAEERA